MTAALCLRDRQRGQRGYVLLTLLLGVALLTIAATVAMQSMAFQIKRDREAEMIHRGTQYARAIRRFNKQTGLFPVRLEDLRDRGGQRFIRKIYKDPITSKDFLPIYEADITDPQGMNNHNQALAQSSSGSTESDSANSSSVPTPTQDQANNQPTSIPAGAQIEANSGLANSTASPGSGSANLFGSSVLPATVPKTYTTSVITGLPVPVGSLIFGVVSASKKDTIREFNHKRHYNEWMFFYHPTYDRGLEIKGPTPLTPAAASLNGSSQPPAQTTANP